MGELRFNVSAGAVEQLIRFEVKTGEGDAGVGDALAEDFNRQLQPIVAMTNSVVDALKASAPGKITIEFGVELGGKAGVPLVTQGSAKANLKFSVTWENK